MNKREKKKLYKNTFIKVKKLHPKKGDIIFMMPDFNRIDFDVAFKYFEALCREKILDDAYCALLPYPIKSIGDKAVAQEFVNAIQKQVNAIQKQVNAMVG